MTAKVDEDRLTVDGRDFLYTVIPELCKADAAKTDPYMDLMKAAFSELIASYIDAGRRLQDDRDMLYRLVDYIVMDRRVISDISEV